MQDTDRRVFDLTAPTWGHNYEMIHWGADDAEMFVWLTPEPREGDHIVIQGKKGQIRAEITDVEWQSNVDDMYRLTVVPA
jgi:hypothetical protein